jgi:hypothetical protein
MAAVSNVLGAHAYMLARYGVDSYEDVSTVVAKLKTKASHLAAFLEEVFRRVWHG